MYISSIAFGAVFTLIESESSEHSPTNTSTFNVSHITPAQAINSTKSFPVKAGKGKYLTQSLSIFSTLQK